MNSLLDMVLGLLGDIGLSYFWRVFAGIALGLGAAYTLLMIFEMDVHRVWPYVVGGILGLVYGFYWQARSSD